MPRGLAESALASARACRMETAAAGAGSGARLGALGGGWASGRLVPLEAISRAISRSLGLSSVTISASLSIRACANFFSVKLRSCTAALLNQLSGPLNLMQFSQTSS
eukprot:4082605-Pleurochrysis_carterae.AAC.1